MVTSDVRQSQRPVWAALTVLLITGMITSLFLASRAKQSGEAAAAAEAQVQVQDKLAPLLTPSDVSQPVSGEPYQTLRALVTRRLLSAGPSDGVTIYRLDGTIVFDLERDRVGTRDTANQERLTRVAQGTRESLIIGEDFHVWVPLRLEVGGPPTGVVELTQPYAPLWESASKPWRLGALAFAALLLPAIGLLAMTFRDSLGRLRASPKEAERKRESSWAQEVPVTQPAAADAMAAIAKEGPVHARTISADQPTYEHPGYRQEVEARMLAEERAAKAEEAAAQLKRELTEVKAGTLTATDEELLRVREQFEDATARLRRAEDEGAGLSERLRTAEMQRAELAERIEREGAAPAGDGEDRAADSGVEARLRAAEERALEAEANARAADLRAAQAEESARLMEERALAAQHTANSEEDQLFAAEERGTAAMERANAAELETKVAVRRAESAEQRVADLSEQLKAYREESAQIGERLAGTKDESIRTAEQLAAAHDQARVAKEQLAALQEQSVRTAEELAAAREEARRAAEQAALSEDRLASARDQLTAAEEQARLSGERADANQGELITLGERATAAEEEVAMLRVQLASAQDQERGSKERLSAAEQRAEQAEEHLQRLAEERRAEAEEAEREAEDAPRLDEVLRITQERLARSADRLQETEQRAREAEHELESARARLEELEGEQRREKLQEALHHLRGDDAAATAPPLEERRVAAPFMKALTMDAKNSVASIHGLILAMKHAENANDTPPMLRKLAAHARKLDHLVADLLDADKLARGDIQLTCRRTDIDALVRRVVDEAAIDADRSVKIESEPVIVAVDPIRVEGIIVGLLNNAVDRSRPRHEIVVRVAAKDGGALISVEDDEPSSDGAMSPVVARFADVHGGWAIVESRPGGGSAFRVFLPDHDASAQTTVSPETNTIDIRDGDQVAAKARRA